MNWFVILTIILSNELMGYCFTIGVHSELRKQIRKNTKKDFGKKFVKLDMSIINSFINVSLDECILKCHKKCRCQAIEYRTRTKYCALVWKYGEVETQPGSYIVHGFVNKIKQQCGDKTCNRKQTCEYVGGASHCIIEECRNPEAGQKVDGNIYTIGSKIISSCFSFEKKSVKFVCSTSGEWWTLAGPQSGITCAELDNANSYISSYRISIVTNELGMTLRCIGSKNSPKNWMVLQRRRYGQLDFHRDFEDYKYGFGHVCGDFWTGLEDIYTIVERSTHVFELIVDLTDWNNTTRNARYREFQIASENKMYQLGIGSYSGGIIGNALGISNGMPFSTYDSVNDPKISKCIGQLQGGWWYNDCQGATLNGRYYWRGELTGNEGMSGVTWYTWHGYNYSLKRVVIKMKEGYPKSIYYNDTSK